MHTDHHASPLNRLPPVVWLLAAPVILTELAFGAGRIGFAGGPDAIGWRLDALQRFAFSPDLMARMFDAHSYPPGQMLRLVSYPFVHGNVTHAVFVVVFTLALGKMVAEVLRPWAVLLVYFGAAVAGALAYMLAPVLAGASVQALFGGYPAVYGLIGAFTYLLWHDLAAQGANKFRAFTLIGFLLGVQLVFGLLFGGGWEWIADIAGFVTGFVLTIPLAPGGWRRLVARLRQR